MNRFVIVDGLPFLLANGKTYAVRWDYKGFTVGAEVKLASVPNVTHSDIAVKAKCSKRLDSISAYQNEQQQEQEDHEDQEQQQEPEIDFSDMTVAEMKEYAKANGIDLGDAKKKADILEAIKNAQDVNGNDSDS